jgi:hypothetical protein
MQIQSTSSVLIQAPLDKVWDFNMDITMIERYHPRTETVTYLSSKTIREAGVAYQCNILQGEEKGSCVEQVTEVVPYKQFTTIIPSDTWGLSDLFGQIEAVTLFEKIDEHTTRMTIRISFDAVSEQAQQALPQAREQFSIQTAETLEAIKTGIENQ